MVGSVGNEKLKFGTWRASDIKLKDICLRGCFCYTFVEGVLIDVMLHSYRKTSLHCCLKTIMFVIIKYIAMDHCDYGMGRCVQCP